MGWGGEDKPGCLGLIGPSGVIVGPTITIWDPFPQALPSETLLHPESCWRGR